MIVYVVFKELDMGEGCTWPKAVFSTYEAAQRYIEADGGYCWEIDSYVVDALETKTPD